MHRTLTVPLAVLALLAFPPAAAQEPPCDPPPPDGAGLDPPPPAFWTSVLGPGSTSAADVAVDPRDPDRVLMAGLRHGPMVGDPYLSNDGGRTWDAGSGIPGHPLAVEFSPANPDVLYAASGVAVHRSIDGGNLWCETARLSATVATLLVDPRLPETVWAGLVNGKVARSDDAALTWTEVGTGLPADRTVFRLATGPSADDLLAATASGAFRSSDGGRTFAASGAGMTGGGVAGTGTVVLSDLAQDPRDRRVVYATQPPGSGLGTDCTFLNTTYAYCLTGRLYRSGDFGASWQEVRGPVLTNADRLGGSKCLRPPFQAVGVTSAGALVASGSCGAWVTRDGGGTWTFLSDTPGSARAYEIQTGPAGRVWIASDGQGVFRSEDGALSFQRAAPGWAGSLSPDGGNVCTVEPLGSGRLIASCGLNRLRAWFFTLVSSDFGRTWEGVEGLREGHVINFAADPAHGNLVVAATKTEGFMRSTDWGRTWKPIPGLPPSAIAVAADPTAEGSFYAIASGGQTVALTPIFGESVPAALWRTRDGGATWTLAGPIPSAIPYALEPSPTTPGVLFLGAWTDPFTAAPQGGLWRSDDAGLTWTRSSGVPEGHTTNAIGFVAGRPEVVLASSDTLYRSTDGGRTFAAVPGMPQNIYAFPRSFATAPGLPGVAYYGTDAQLLRTEDAGATWSEAAAGLEGHDVEGVRNVLTDPDDPNGFYVVAGGYAWAWGTRFTSYGRYLFRGSEA